MEIITHRNDDIPLWLKDNMLTYCPYCKAPLVDSGVTNDDGVMQLTQRYCPNPYCNGHMAVRIVNLAKMFNVQGIGAETSRSIILEHGLKSHLEIIPIWFKEKPEVYLWEVAKAAQIYGYDKKWQEEFDGYGSMDDYFTNCKRKLSIALVNKDYLKYAESFFSVKPPLAKQVIKVMISGSIDKFNNKQDFIDFINRTAGRYVQVRMVGKRKNDVDCLIKEPWSADHSKTEVALKNNIPILTSQEFLGFIYNKFIAPNVQK